jgi:hypothetical protein
MQRTGDGSERRISDVLSNDMFRRSVLYREFYGPLGIEYQIAVALAPHQGDNHRRWIRFRDLRGREELLIEEASSVLHRVPPASHVLG